MSKKENLVWIIFCVVGIIFFIIGISIFFSAIDKQDRVETIGIITQIERYKDIDGDTRHTVFVSYNVNGIEYESKLNGYSSSFYKGKEIEIYYDKNNPRKIGSASLDLLFLIFPGIGLVFAIIGGAGIFNRIRKNKIQNQLKENGDIVYANYIETVLNRGYSVNGRHPYNIICEWNNTIDNKKYTFKSDNIWTNPESIIQERNIKMFPVYINREKIKDYLVDIEQITKNVVDLS